MLAFVGDHVAFSAGRDHRLMQQPYPCQWDSHYWYSFLLARPFEGYASNQFKFTLQVAVDGILRLLG